MKIVEAVTFFDPAELYGPYTNEELIGKALEPYHNQVVIAIKFGFDLNGTLGALSSSPKSIRNAIEGSLKRLSTKPWIVPILGTKK